MEQQIEQIAVDKIDEPTSAMRSQMSEEKLQELCASIKLFGLMSPIVVRPVGKRYEIIAGHRRFIACSLLKMRYINCIVNKMQEGDADIARMHENLFREDINPVDEARYIAKLVDDKKMKPEELVAMTGKSQQYLQGRYELLQYPDYLIDGIQHETISLGVAAWLVRIDDDNVRREYTRFAISQGVKVQEAQRWYESWKLGSLPRDAATYVPPSLENSGEVKPVLLPCVICRNTDELGHLQMHYAHGTCVQTMQQHIQAMQDDRAEEERVRMVG